VVRTIRPTVDELIFLKRTVAELKRQLKKATKREVVLAGSVAKDTFLAAEGDIDLFILFKEKRSKEEMKKELVQIFKKAFPRTAYQMNYAEHPYIRFHWSGKKVDLVPAYKMSVGEQLLTAVDRSVLHTKYILAQLRKNQQDEVRLLKKFLKSAGLYGAEIKTEGFSGYLCELLIIRYGSFSRLLRAASAWKLPVIIDLKNYHKKADYELLVKKFSRQLIVIDPTDKNRNVAAPISDENLKRFMAIAKQFTKKPSAAFFSRPQDFSSKVAALKKKYAIAVISFEKPPTVDDVLWGQLKKFMHSLEKILADFEVQQALADADDLGTVRIAIVAKKKTAGGVIELNGPPLEMKEHVANFKKAHVNCKFVKRSGRIIAYVRKPVKTLVEAVGELTADAASRFSHLPLGSAAVELA
ncbi:MAG: CCA tRNA nucleotidyltransferase, partial [Candidatus Micrarchaeota archaeon]